MEQDKQKSHGKILAVAKTLFAQKGFKNTTIRDIANAAKLNSSLISYHFNGKNGILETIIHDFMSKELTDINEVLDRQITSFDSFETVLEIFLNGVILKGIGNWEALKIILNEAHELSKIPGFNASSISFVNTLSSFIKRAQDLNYIRNDFSSDTLADNLFTLTIDQISNWKINTKFKQFDISDKATRESWIKENLQLIFNGIR